MYLLLRVSQAFEEEYIGWTSSIWTLSRSYFEVFIWSLCDLREPSNITFVYLVPKRKKQQAPSIHHTAQMYGALMVSCTSLDLPGFCAFSGSRNKTWLRLEELLCLFAVSCSRGGTDWAGYTRAACICGVSILPYLSQELSAVEPWTQWQQ